MTIIVHLSDPHFGTEVPVVVSAVVEAVRAMQPDVVIVSGDITQRARSKEFRAASDFLDALSAEAKLVIPGNHDIPLFNIVARLFSPYAGYKRALGARESVWIGQHLGVIGFDATSPLRHTRGALDPADMEHKIRKLRQRLRPDAILIACTHQPLHTAWPEDNEEVLIRAEQTAHVFSELNVDMVLSGHVHVPLRTTTQNVFPSLARHFILAGAGSAVSNRIRPGAPNSFNTISVGTQDKVRTIAIAQYIFDHISQKFISDIPMRFTSGAKGWKSS